MKILAIVLFMLAGVLSLGGISVLVKSAYIGVGTVFGAFVVPGLLVWWGIIALDRSNRKRE